MKNYFIILLFAFIFIIPAVSAANFYQNLSVLDCKNSTDGISYNSPCFGSYQPFPNTTCSSNGNRLLCNDGFSEDTFGGSGGNPGTAGNEIVFANGSALSSSCASIKQVLVCQKWFSSFQGQACSLKVSSNGTDFTIFNSSCPSTDPNVPVICQDITTFKSFTCASVFGSNGTRLRTSISFDPPGTSSVDVSYIQILYSDSSLDSTSLGIIQLIPGLLSLAILIGIVALFYFAYEGRISLSQTLKVFVFLLLSLVLLNIIAQAIIGL